MNETFRISMESRVRLVNPDIRCDPEVANNDDASDDSIVKLIEQIVDPNLLWQPSSGNAIDWPSFVALKIPVVRDWINQNFKGVK